LRNEKAYSSPLRTTREQIPQVPRQVPKTPVDHRSATPDVDSIEADAFDELPAGTILCGRYRITKVFGRGNFSVCYGAFDQEDNREVAVKRFHHEWFAIGIHEAALLSQFKYSYRIVNSFETFWDGQKDDDKHYHIVMEALRGDSQLALPACNCVDPRHKPIGCPIRHRALAKIMAQLLSGLAELHHQGVIHGDLTPSNILPSRRNLMDTKLIDLSNAIKKEDRRNYENEYEVQTACYRAPQMLLGSGPLGKHIDVWSVGIIALELLFGNDVVIPGGIEGAELLRSPVDGRDALVRRLIEVFGSIRACEGGKYWRDAYGGLSARWGWQKGHGKVELGDNVGALPEVLAATGNPRLQEFLKGLLEVDYTQRLSVDSALRDPWLVGTLLGEWGNVLMNPGWCGDGEEDAGRRVRPRIGAPPSPGVGSPGAQAPLMPHSPPLAESPLPLLPDHGGEDWMDGEDGVDMDEDGYEEEEEDIYEAEDEVHLVE
jgi:serine/threonine protein kinase